MGNPVIDQRFGVFTADPAALVVGDTVYLYTGHDENPGNSTGSFKMFDWLCFSTKDMKKWTYHGPVLARRDFSWGRSIPAPGDKEAEFAVADAWAAQVVQRGSKFYFYVTTRSSLDAGEPRAIGVAVGNSPVGPFKAIGEPIIRGTEMPDDIDDFGKHIDPTVWVDDDGTPYLAWGNTTGATKPNGFAYEHCYMVKLAPNMIQITGDIWTQHLDNYTEGPWLYKRGQWYYLVYASHTLKTQTNANTGNERISYAMAESITGPWTSKGQLTGSARGFTIHPSIIEFHGQSYFIYHTDAPFSLKDFYGQQVSGAIGRRAVCIEYLYYNEDGTIKPITQTTAGISVPPQQ